MSLYGLDIIENDEKRHILEINGINSGMKGFSQIYGDDRIKKKVYGMLEDKYGKLTLNDGTFLRNEFKKKHPFKFARDYAICKIPGLRNIVFPMPEVLLSADAETDWLGEKLNVDKIPFDEFERYSGQESTVINSANQKLPHPSVNNLISEDIARNKFLQYMVLRNSEISENIIPSMLVGLGAADNNSLVKMASSNGFVAKPILGNQGRGVRFLTQEEGILFYQNTGGPIYGSSANIFSQFNKNEKETYLEDLIAENDFEFEYGLSLLQPFIESKKKINQEEVYSSIRAIVCNGKFVDAYRRISENKKVNLSQDAKAVKLYYDSGFPDFCENVARVFEEKTKSLNPFTFREELYMEYFNAIERPVKRWNITLEGKVMHAVIRALVEFADAKK